MLPDKLKKENTRFDNGLVWSNYLEAIGDYAKTVDREFLSQICLEHYDRFNNYFPKFDLESHKIRRIHLTASEIYSDIRYDCGKHLDFWYSHMDAFLNGVSDSHGFPYPLLKHCGTKHTWPFPPVIIAHEFGVELGGKNLGSLYHLIEGTHRVSFINRLFELEKVQPNSNHEFIVLMP